MQNNLFGLKPNGAADFGWVSAASTSNSAHKNNLIGGPGTFERNVISGAFSANGVDLSHGAGPPTTGNRVVGNFIGTDPGGTGIAAYTQNLRGVVFKDNVNDNFVTDNVIGGAKEEALWVQFDTNPRNFITGNHVGVALDGAAINNAKYGLSLRGPISRCRTTCSPTTRLAAFS